MRHNRFEWHADKAAGNLAKHSVRIEDAAAVLSDPFCDRFHVEAFDHRHSADDEDR